MSFINNPRWLLLVCDLLAAALLVSVIGSFNKFSFAFGSLIVWLISLGLFWLATLGSRSYFRTNRYSRLAGLFAWSALATVLYIFVLRSGYSLQAFVWVWSGWLVYALLFRWFYYRRTSPLRLLAKKGSLDLRAYPGIEVIEVEQPDQVNSADFDYLVFNPQAYYSLSWRRFFSHAQVSGTSVFTVAEINELLLGRISVDLLQESWVGGFFKPNYLYLVIKRFSDILVSLLLLPLVLLLGILVSVTILLTMGWPVLFVQQRVGREGKVFRLYKFRTMVKVAGVAGETRAQDPRITPVGACLRKLRLDELPQFYNVLKGDMSLIGPRPETVTLVEKYIQEVPLYTLRQVVRPGISGWAQVNQGYAVGVAGTYEKLRYDIYYVKHLSLALDLKILVKTLLIILTGQGAR